jgi:phage terminase small subunit
MARSRSNPLVPLSPRHKAFAHAFLRDKQAKSAAIAAGYSPKSAAVTGHHLLRRDDIQAYLQSCPGTLATGAGVTPQEIAERYRDVAMANPLDYVVEDNGEIRMKRPSELTEKQRYAIADLKVKTYKDRATGELRQVFEYVFEDRAKARDSLARIAGMFRDRVEVEHSGQVQALFRFVASSPQTSETSARLRAKFGAARQGRSSSCAPSLAGTSGRVQGRADRDELGER